MCGIAGFLNCSLDVGTLHKVGESLQARGPDDQGIWQEPDYPLSLVHRRLSILDTSKAGHQPMISKSGRYVIAYNGEIYNYRKLNQWLQEKGVVLQSSCDTETLLACIEELGLAQALTRINGMFAFALWDRQTKKLYLVRDRVGIKPLYYAILGEKLLFASELSALHASNLLDKNIDHQALSQLLQFNYIASPNSIYQDVFKLEPGSIATFNLVDGELIKDIQRYWSVKDDCAHAPQQSAAVDQNYIHNLIKDAVSSRMIADVPLGSFLSGGIDSSLVTAVMQSHASRPVKTFSIGFEDQEFNEAVWAKKVAQHLGCEHAELYVSKADLLSVIPQLAQTYNEPFADSSQLPTVLLTRLAKQSMTVCLSGDGGDEVFAGYSRYFLTMKIWRYVNHLPLWFRRVTAALLQKMPVNFLVFFLKAVQSVFMREKVHNYRDKLPKLLKLLSASSFAGVYQCLVSNTAYSHSLLSADIDDTPLILDAFSKDSLGLVEQMMLADSHTYLPGDILTKVDRASMANSLEVRVPLLDHRLMEAAWRLPIESKVKGGKGKLVLRDILSTYIPNHLFERPKMGFGVPLAAWLRGPLREWANDLLSADLLRRQAVFDEKSVSVMWQKHHEDKGDYHFVLWPILMFQAWYQQHQ